MTRRYLAPFLLCPAVVLVASCGKQVPPAAAPNAPSCAIEASREFTLGGGTEVREWDLRAAGLRRLAVRLLVATDGKARPAAEAEYKWDRWAPDDPPATLRLVLLMTDGRAFGAKGKWLPRLRLDAAGSPPHAMVESRPELVLEGDWHERMSTAMTPQPLLAQSVLFARLFLPRADAALSYTMRGSDAAAVAAASSGGQAVVAVLLEWEPQ
jgi:hypothetical protein